MNIRDYKSMVSSMGCLLCGADAELHHPRDGQGMSQRASDWCVIPLCPEHHRGPQGWHGDRTAFRLSKGMSTEMDMLAIVIRHTVSRMTGSHREDNGWLFVIGPANRGDQ